MKHEVLSFFENQEGYVSGEAISQALGVSRNTVWKAINQLRKDGYRIESSTKNGYRLVFAPDYFAAQQLEQQLTTRWMGRQLRILDQVDSTNEEVKRLAQRGAEHGLAVLAETQTKGKGRLGRGWVGDKLTGIWLSVLLRPKLAPREIGPITLVVGLAVCKTIRAVAGCDALLKWPNDVVIGRKKVCGILSEMQAEMDRVDYVVVGIGINVNTHAFPPELAHKATSLCLETGKEFARSELVCRLLLELEQAYDSFEQHGFDARLLQEYTAVCASLHRPVTVQRGGKTLSGEAVGVNEEGELLVKDAQGKILVVSSGEVTVQGIY